MLEDRSAEPEDREVEEFMTDLVEEFLTDLIHFESSCLFECESEVVWVEGGQIILW